MILCIYISLCWTCINVNKEDAHDCLISDLYNKYKMYSTSFQKKETTTVFFLILQNLF